MRPVDVLPHPGARLAGETTRPVEDAAAARLPGGREGRGAEVEGPQPASTGHDPAARRKPRVLVVPPSYFRAERVLGGGERYAFEYARALAEITPTTLALFDREADRERIGNLEVRTFGVRRIGRGVRLPLTRESWRALGEFEVIHSMVLPTPLTDLLLLSARLRRQTVVLTDVGGGAPCLSTYLAKLHPRLDLNRSADGLALLSEHASGLFGDWKQPRTVLYGGVDLTSFGARTGSAEGYALFVGRLLPHKGVLELIEAIEPATPLRVVGRPLDTAYLEKLKTAARGKAVTFLLDADDAELGRQYAGATVVVQPSLPYGEEGRSTAELLGLVALEGMAHGKPVIVTRTASLPELVVDGRTGFIVEPYDAAGLRARIEDLMGSPDLYATMGANARRHVERNFTWGHVVARGMALYTRLLAGGPRRERVAGVEG